MNQLFLKIPVNAKFTLDIVFPSSTALTGDATLNLKDIKTNSTSAVTLNVVDNTYSGKILMTDITNSTQNLQETTPTHTYSITRSTNLILSGSCILMNLGL